MRYNVVIKMTKEFSTLGATQMVEANSGEEAQSLAVSELQERLATFDKEVDSIEVLEVNELPSLENLQQA